MELMLSTVAAITGIVLFVTLIECFIGFNKIKSLANQCIVDQKTLPMVSIIVSALNEENDIENTLLSLIYLDYPQIEIIAVNDRSTDKTPQILDQLKKRYPHLRILHIQQLPEGWFGKNHALHVASKLASGEWLLFSDADVLMKKDSLLRAMSYVLEKKCDHLTIFEKHIHKEFGLKIFLLAQYITYSMVMKPWRVRYSWSKKSIGHGAFNLINKKVYQQCGGHETIAMECMDDLKLGELMKKNGFRQDTVDGRDYIEREWYKSLAEMINGCKKNSFAYFNYRPLMTFLVLIGSFIFFIGPFFGLLLSGPLRWANGLNIILMLCLSMTVAKQFRLQKRYALFYPLGISILLYSVWNSLYATYQNKGVLWRGTLYSFNSIRNKKI